MSPSLRRFVLSLLLAAGSTFAGGRTVRLSSWDVLTTEGAEVTLGARLQRKGIRRKPVAGRTLEFVLVRENPEVAQVLGRATTDEEGDAELVVTAPERGEFEVLVRFAGDDRYAPGQNTSLISVRDPARPVAIVDIDHTLQHTSPLRVARGNTDDEPLAGAREAIEALSEHYDIVYCSARMRRYLFTTKAWLERWGFPANPLFLLDKRDYPEYDEAQYKIDVMTEIRKSFPSLAFGVGDKETDAKAYTTIGIRAFIFVKTGGIEGAEKVPGWAEVVRRVLGRRTERFQVLHGAEGLTASRP
jgi:hypothetical protein